MGYTQVKTKQKIETLVSLRTGEGLTYDEALVKMRDMGIKASLSTIKRWAASDEYRLLVKEHTTDHIDTTEWKVQELSDTAIITLKSIMDDKAGKVSAKVKVDAASKILDLIYAGKIKDKDKEELSDREEMERMYKILEARKQQQLLPVSATTSGTVVEGEVTYLPEPNRG